MNQADDNAKPTVSRRFDRTLSVIGKSLITTGLLLLAFVAYQLWGTGLAENRAQAGLKKEFARELTAQKSTLPKFGKPVTRIQIDAIGLDKIVVAGTSYEALEKGPGLFSGSPLPGQFGNVAIAGHRTSYGAPFGRINELETGDEIVLTRAGSTFTYIVSEDPFIVKPNAVEVVKTLEKQSARLTLVTCHPKWTSKNRLVVKATLVSTVKPQPPTEYAPAAAQPTEVLSGGWFHDPSAIPWAMMLAMALVMIAVLAQRLTARGRRAWKVYSVAAAAFAPTLFVFFGFLTRLLPANI